MGFKQLTYLFKPDGSARGKNINRQIIYSFLAKGVAVCISLVQVPLLLHHLGKESYGIWLTILSIVSWLNVMDIGIGNGLRNKLSESLAKNDIGSAKKYISTAYISLGVIMIFLLILCSIIIPSLNWQSIFNTSKELTNRSIVITLLATVSATLLGFVLILVNQVLNAVQKNALSALPNILFSLLFIGLLYILPHFISINLSSVAYLYSGTYLFSYIIFSIYVYNKWYHLTPDFKSYKKSYIQDILFIGIRFFVIQIASIVIFSTDNFIITRLFGPELVASFNITFRIFGFISMLLSLVMAPLWSAYTEAYAKKEYNWIRSRLRLMNIALIPLIVILLIIVKYFDELIYLWINEKVTTPKYLPALMAFYVLISVWNNIYAYFLNGISRTKEQLLTSVLAMIINIPLSVLLAKNFNLGLNGIIIASITCLSFFSVIGPSTTYKILKKHD